MTDDQKNSQCHENQRADNATNDGTKRHPASCRVESTVTRSKRAAISMVNGTRTNPGFGGQVKDTELRSASLEGVEDNLSGCNCGDHGGDEGGRLSGDIDLLENCGLAGVDVVDRR